MLRALKVLIAVIILSGYHHVNAQNIADSSMAYPMVAGCLGGQIPSGDMADRFGESFSIGPTFLYKTRSNVLFGIDYNFIYSDNVKDKESVLNGITTVDGNIIDGNGMFAEFFLYESAHQVMGKFGKLIPIKNSNPNSGLMILGGVGALQHKIWIYNREDTAPQISGEYKKGYDKLRNGLAVGEFVGYSYASNNGRINFFIGLEGTQAWTQSRRSYDFATKSVDTSTQFDMLWGLKFGWVFPIYKTIQRDYYYY